MVKKSAETKTPRELTKRQLSHHKKQERRQKIILFSGILVVVAVILLTISGWFFGEFMPYNKTIVKIYDVNIKESAYIDTLEYYSRMYANAGQTLDLASESDYILSSMVQTELMIRAAEQLGVTITDEEIDAEVKDLKLNVAQKAIVRSSMLTQKLKTGYFTTQVPDSGNQVLMNAMLVESEEVVPGIRSRLLNGDNFSMLAEEFAVNVVSIDNKGVFDWHPDYVLKNDIGSVVPVDWAFSAEAAAGDISDAIADNASSKKLGYWLINLMEKPADGKVKTQALLLSSLAEANRVKALLESGDNLSALADTYSQYSPSQMGHGEMTVVESDNISTPFNTYTFNPDTPIGKWSDPIKDDRYYTKSGVWIVQIVDKSDTRKYSEDDREKLINKALTDWTSNLWLDAASDVIYKITDSDRQLAIQKATERLSATTGG